MKKAKLFSTGIFILSQFLFFSAFSQQGKTGVGNITVANTVVNAYTNLTVDAAVTNTSITVTSSAGITAGDLIYIIQMYGADVNAYTDANPTNSLPNDTSYGQVKNYHNAGHNEFAEVTAVPNGTTITLDCGLQYDYTAAKKVQVIRVPRYTTLTLTSPGTITCPAWNGSTGGVVVVEVQGNTIINAGASINVVGLGFRGGVKHRNAGGFGATNTGSTDLLNGARKGESIVGDTTYYKATFSGTSCEGNVANGGGGGDGNNCGGGGGSNAGLVGGWNGKGNPDISTANNITSWNKEAAAFSGNVSSGGGRGGYAFSSNSSGTADPTVTGPNDPTWGGDDRHSDGGWGGIPLFYTAGKLFLGGGGGAGDDNDGYSSSGANGGGIVYLMSYGTVSGAGQIFADGAVAANTSTSSVFGTCTGVDGAGGGGGGGAVVINSVGAITLTNIAPISSQGGKGGNASILCNFSTNHDAYGPGGGGGGGYVATSNAVAGINVNGGANGIVSGSGSNYSSNVATKFPPNGATKGGVGTSSAITNFYLTTTNYTICAGSSASLSVTIGGTPPSGISVGWYTVAIGGASISTGNPYNTGALTVGTYTYYTGTCPGTYRAPVIVTVTTAPTLTATAAPTSICAGQSSTLTATGAASYTWSANAGSVTTSTASVSPVSNATYTVTGANGTCISTQTVAVTVLAAPTLTVTATPTVICSGQSALLTGNGAASYTWSANAGSVNTSTASVSPTSTTIYTVTGGNGTCTSSQTISLNVITTPTIAITASNTVTCSGTPLTFTASGATTFTWSANAGSATTNTVSVSPGSNTTYTVTGSNGGGCTSTQTISVTAATTPTVTAVSSNAVICSGTAVTFTASGATTYTWSANAGSVNTATATASPSSNTVYTVTGANGNCLATQTVSVNVTTTPTVAIAASNTVVCSGTPVTFTASGATTYTWSANAGSATTNTVSVSPGGNTTYTVTGDNGGGCISTQTISVTAAITPTVTAITSNTTICSGTAVTFTASGATTYTWSANAGSVNTATATASPSVNTTYTVTGANGNCLATQTVAVNVTTTPTVTAVASNTIICNGSSVVLTASGANTYTWSANANSATTTTVSVSPSANATYTVTGDNGGGCTSTQTVAVTVNNPPTQADSVSNPASCNQSNGSYVINSVTGGTGPYQVNFNNGGFTNISSFAYTVPNLTAGSYPVVIKDNVGCTYTTSIIINNSGGITKIDSIMKNASCNPSNNGAIVVTSISGGQSPYTLSINGGAFNAVTLPDSLKNLIAGTYTVVVKDNSGCIHTSLITVGSVTGVSQANTTSYNALCNPANSGSIVVNTINGGTGPYQLSMNGGAFNTVVLPDSIANLTAGNYSLTIMDANGCTTATVVTVGSNGGPSGATVTSVSDTCGKNVGVLNVTNVSGGAPAYQYSLDGVTFQTSTTFTALATGVYTVTVKDNNGCTYQQIDSVKSVGPTSSPTVTAQSTTTFCQGGSVILSSSSATGNTWSTGATTQTITVNASGTYSLSISQNGCTANSNTVSVLVNPLPTITVNSASMCLGTSTTLNAGGGSTYTWSPAIGLSSTSTATVTANPAATTVYTVAATDVNGCTSFNTSTVTVNPTPPKPTVNPDSLFYCLYQNAPPLNASVTTGDSLTWYDASGTIIPHPTPGTSQLGVTTYYVSQNIGPCVSVRDSIKVFVVPGPSAAFSANPSGVVMSGTPIVFTPVNPQSPYVAYSWNFDNTSSSANTSGLYSPSHSYTDVGTYCPKLIVISSQTGCKDSSTICLDVINAIEITIPNVFSPNGDGINEVFSVKSSGINTLNCQIYDRWGLKLYEWNGANGFWDGTDQANGKTVTDGTYYYVIEATDVRKENHSYKGFLLLIH